MFAEEEVTTYYSFDVNDFMHRCALSPNTAKRVYEGLQNTKALENELQLLEKHKISFLSFLHPQFPQLLKEIHLPPIGIYVRGIISSCTPSLAVVGSRDANPYAQRVIDRIMPPLCEQGVVIVSGGARGVDTMAHRAAVANRCPTIAVMGCGLLKISRDENIALFPHIIEGGGAIVSGFPLTMEAQAPHFPARNRIIAGLGQGCLVVQAAKKSGALITAQYALEQGREVFAVPGAIDDPMMAGCHNLLRQGALLAESAQDILDAIPIFSAKPAQLTITTQKELQEIEEQLEKSGDQVNDRLVSLCAKPVSVDELARVLALDLFETQTRLFELQMAGRVQQNFAGLWHI